MNRDTILGNMKSLWEDVNKAYDADLDVQGIIEGYTEAVVKTMAETLVWSGILGEYDDGHLEPISLDACIKSDYEEILGAGIDQIYEIGIHTCDWTWDDLAEYLQESIWNEDIYWKDMISGWRGNHE